MDFTLQMHFDQFKPTVKSHMITKGYFPPPLLTSHLPTHKLSSNPASIFTCSGVTQSECSYTGIKIREIYFHLLQRRN